MNHQAINPEVVRNGNTLSPHAPAWEGPVFIPRVDIHESDEGLTLEADLPGVLPENLEIDIDDNVLRLVGRAAESVPTEARPVYEEYTAGNFARSFILSDEIDRDHVNASLNDGVLRLRLPKAKSAQPQKIEVRTE